MNKETAKASHQASSCPWTEISQALTFISCPTEIFEFFILCLMFDHMSFISYFVLSGCEDWVPQLHTLESSLSYVPVFPPFKAVFAVHMYRFDQKNVYMTIYYFIW